MKHDQASGLIERGLTVGVLADTHGWLRPEIAAVFTAGGVGRILHAGDVGAPAVLAALEAIAPVVAVRGNVDRGEWAAALPAVADLLVAGQRIVMTHVCGRPEQPAPQIAALLAEARPALLICGHSHRPLLAEWAAGTLWLNPGAAGRRGFHRRATVALARISPEGVEAELIDLGSR